MPRIGVNWGSSPDLSGPMSSLGASLAGAMGGGGNGSKAARDAAYMESLQHHNQVYDNQAAQLAAKTAADQAEADRKAQDYTSQQTAGKALGDAAALRIGPAPVAVYGPEQVPGTWQGQHDQWDADVNAARAGASYVLAGGGNADARAKGFKEFYNPMPVPVEVNKSPDKAIFNKDKTMQLVPDPKNPGRFTQVPVGGITAGSNNQEAIDAVTRANDAYQRLADSGGVGPWIGGTVGRTIEHFIPGNEHAKMRDEYEAARNKLILMERQRLMRGQGAVSDKDAAQIENMFPRFDSTDPQVGIRTLQEMKKRLTAGQAMLNSGGDTQNTEGEIQPGHVEDGHRYVGGDPSSPSSWEPL